MLGSVVRCTSTWNKYHFVHNVRTSYRSKEWYLWHIDAPFEKRVSHFKGKIDFTPPTSPQGHEGRMLQPSSKGLTISTVPPSDKSPIEMPEPPLNGKEGLGQKSQTYSAPAHIHREIASYKKSSSADTSTEKCSRIEKKFILHSRASEGWYYFYWKLGEGWRNLYQRRYKAACKGMTQSGVRRMCLNNMWMTNHF